jgi:hypothetical protein
MRALPINPRRRRSEARRTSIKKYFRVTPEENAAIASNAEAAGLEQASYLRVQALGTSKVRQVRRMRVLTGMNSGVAWVSSTRLAMWLALTTISKFERR